MSGCNPLLSDIGVVVIGRNEGERLYKCLKSIDGIADSIVYVDSGSTDGSQAMVHAMGIGVIALDMRTPFTAARARNEGFKRLQELCPHLRYVQFVDGDCEFSSNWLPLAVKFLAAHTDVAVVCGRRRERYPNLSVYNMLCDIEWDTPIGEAKACGGDALMQVAAFKSVGGFRNELIAGEEPELCIRLRAAGWRVWRLDEEMTLHDAAILHFGQWWNRALRFGHAMAEGNRLHGAPPERHWIKESRRAWLWGLGIPCTTIVMFSWLGFLGLALLLVYPLQIARIAIRERRSPRENWWYALFLVIGKFPEMLGQVKFLLHRFLGNRSGLIEYKQ